MATSVVSDQRKAIVEDVSSFSCVWPMTIESAASFLRLASKDYPVQESVFRRSVSCANRSSRWFPRSRPNLTAQHPRLSSSRASFGEYLSWLSNGPSVRPCWWLFFFLAARPSALSPQSHHVPVPRCIDELPTYYYSCQEDPRRLLPHQIGSCPSVGQIVFASLLALYSGSSSVVMMYELSKSMTMMRSPTSR